MLNSVKLAMTLDQQAEYEREMQFERFADELADRMHFLFEPEVFMRRLFDTYKGDWTAVPDDVLRDELKRLFTAN